MKKLFIIPLFLTMSAALMAQTLNQDYLNYIEAYKQAAVNQELTHKIPACITLAQGMLESGAGKSELATAANNHFGIKCHSDWTGATYTHDDETANECFRKYSDAAQSYEDHALFLMKPRYQKLFQLEITDYKGWARGLKECGYATDANYAPKLIKLIEDYNLVAVTEAAKHSKESKKVAESAASADASAASTTAAGAKSSATATSATAGKGKAAKTTAKQQNQKKSTKKSAKKSSSSKSTADKSAAQKSSAAAAAQQTVDEAFRQSGASAADESETATVGKSFRDRKINPSQVAAVDLYVGHTVRRQGIRRYVIAEAGDSYAGIAAEFNIEYRRLLRYNGADKYSHLTKGQKVWINCKAPKK